METSCNELQISYHSRCMLHIVAILGVLVFLTTGCSEKNEQIRIGVFHVDASPPIGSPVAYAPARKIVDSLSARGVVILSDKAPIVLCAVDWLGIANEGMDRWKESLAKAAHTTTDRVSVHALHQHDGLRCDFTVESILDEYGLGGTRYDTAFLLSTIESVAKAVRHAYESAEPVTHLGFGKAKVKKVASNRRILGEDGKVKIMRWSKSTDSLAIAAPEGLIDPWLKSVSFWQDDTPLAVLTYYAVHPQSYYGEGDVTCEFVGIARNEREKALGGLPHIHFNGAGGNVAAGKYNDGSVERRPILAKRMEEAMRQAWENIDKFPLRNEEVGWKGVSVKLPLGKHLVENDLKAILASDTTSEDQKFSAAKHLAWLQRTQEGHLIDVSSLKLGKVWMLNLPGELFVEYQLAAQQMRPQDEVVTAAYEEYGPGYIGIKKAYAEGGYETSERASRVGSGSEEILMQTIQEVLKQE
ncbi:hypothetical protein OKW21_004167 [Catalinimonas alkaloidigena]|uniref:hypothetical protein n=1 Tax=Catalinimonas alkaloidigena TaxID=1075417 RepID=UPI0024059F18|nr:hypothetical protein [Catalinimonas alkaloidigena]MDF9798904.1 hypothetical protein [Catalinimonas alkaloidigena]